MGKRLHIHPENPQKRLIKEIAECCAKGGVIVYPTDTVYAIGCDIQNKKAMERLCQIKGIKPEKSQFSFICDDLKAVGSYAIHISTPIFKMMKRALPGPYTFIVEASKEVPKHFQSRRKTVGIRVTDHPVPQAIIAQLGRPILSTSLRDEEGVYEYDPDEIFMRYGKQVDIFVDAGWGGSEPSTVIDCTTDDGDFIVLREGLGSMDII